MTFKRSRSLQKGAFIFGSMFLLIGVAGFLFKGHYAHAKNILIPEQQVSTLHPTFPLLDENGENVLETVVLGDTAQGGAVAGQGDGGKGRPFLFQLAEQVAGE